MAQHDYIIANQSGAAFRSDLNNGLAAIVSQNSGAAQPSTTYAYQWWADTTTGLLKIRNAANNAWITLFQLDGEWTTLALENGTAAAPSLYFKDSGTDTGLFSPGADQLAVATGGVERVEFGTTEVVFNDDGADVDFRVEGDTNADLFKIDAGLDQVQVANLNGGPLAGMRNRIINGNFAIGQRGTTFASSANNNDAYTLDRWYILSDGNDAIDVTRETSVVPTNQKYAIALDVETANKKFGIAQIIESDNCVGLTGGTVTLSFKAKVSATTKLDNVKAAVVAWSGTADTVTSDIISAWGAEGTNPTLIANATYENTPANLNVTTSYATYSITASVDTASTTNIIVFIWSDVTDTTAGDFLYVTDVQLEPGAVATPFEQRPIGTELALCQRYYEKSYELGTTPGGAATAGSHWFTSLGITANVLSSVLFSVKKRTSPTVSIWDTAGNANKASSGDASLVISTNNTQSSIVQYAGDSGIVFRQSDPISGAVTVGYQWVASSEL